MTKVEITLLIQNTFWLAAEEVLFHHTNPWELDAALTAWGYGTGPCEAQDHVGLEPVLARVPTRPVPILPRMVAEGRMGKIGGVGYYRYPGGGGAVIDPLIEDLIREEAWFAKVTRSERDDYDLIKMMNAALAPVTRRLYQAEVQDVPSHLAHAVHFPKGRMNAIPT
jgi:3-hydroxyacyl-CoA dehydrogenase